MIVEHAILPVRWKQALHHFSDPCPLVEHFIPVFDSELGSTAGPWPHRAHVGLLYCSGS